MTRILVAIIGLLISVIPREQVDQTSADATVFWERMIAAKGGRERLHGVSSLVMLVDGRQRRATDPWRSVGDIRESIVYQFPDRFWNWLDTRPSRPDAFSVSVGNGMTRRVWFASGGDVARVQPWSDDYLTDLLQEDQLAYLLETRFVQPKPIALSINPKTKFVTLRVAFSVFDRIEYTVDPATMLPIECLISRRVTIPTTSTPVATDPVVRGFEAYRSIDGIQMPSRQRGERQNLSFIFNPDIDPKLFETPPTGVTNGDEWKKYLKK